MHFMCLVYLILVHLIILKLKIQTTIDKHQHTHFTFNNILV